MYIFEAEFYLHLFEDSVIEKIDIPQEIVSRDDVWRHALERALAMESEEQDFVGIKLIAE